MEQNNSAVGTALTVMTLLFFYSMIYASSATAARIACYLQHQC